MVGCEPATFRVHAVTSVSSVPNQYAAYDAMGNMTCRNADPTTGHTCSGSSPTGAQLSYDVEGRLVSWTAPSGTVGNASYLYDNQGNRVLTHAMSASSTTNTIYFDGYTETVLKGSSTTTTKYYSTSGQRVAVRVGTATLDYLVSDPLGSNTVAFNCTGQVIALQHYSPYGTGDYSWGTMPTTYNYATQRLDSQTGLLYDNFRYYDPLIGRFTRADTVETNAAGLDPYAYVGDNPESRNDPTGHRMLGADGVSEGNIGPTGYLVTWEAAYAGWIWDYSTSAETHRYTYYNPNTDTNNSPSAKFSRVTGFTDLQNTFNNPHASGWDKTVAVGNFISTNANNLFQLSMILGGGEGDAAELGGETLVKDLVDVCGGGLSFTATTPVATEHGKQAIGALEVGEKVWAYNPQTHHMELEPIQHIWLNHDSDLVDLTLATTAKGSHGKTIQHDEVIHTNERHPFLTKEKGFVPVSQLTKSMHIRRADGSYGTVTSIRVVSGAKWMYNLEVAQDHTFVVGDGQWVVHNSNCGILPQLAEARAREISGTIGDWSKRFLTVGVATVDDGGVLRTLIATNEKASSSLVKLVDALRNPGEELVSLADNQGRHAEQVLVEYAKNNGLQILGLGASNDFCNEICGPMLIREVGQEFLGQSWP